MLRNLEALEFCSFRMLFYILLMVLLCPKSHKWNICQQQSSKMPWLDIDWWPNQQYIGSSSGSSLLLYQPNFPALACFWFLISLIFSWLTIRFGEKRLSVFSLILSQNVQKVKIWGCLLVVLVWILVYKCRRPLGLFYLGFRLHL